MLKPAFGALLYLTLLAPLVVGVARGEEAIDFVRDIQPMLAKHCHACHGEEKAKSGLRLDIRSEAFRGGELFGPAIVGGKSSESPLLRFVADPDAELRMPPEGDPLTAAEIKLLTDWIDAGAPWPPDADRARLVDRRDHWSFQPPRLTPIPPVDDAHWPREALDRFVLAKLEAAGLRPSPEADRIAWIRRVTFDLIGVPPTPEEVDAFLSDVTPTAYETVVDRLLASPHHGEHWGQHWLDVVRYADTHGFEVNTERPHAWPYRDYVIRSFNDDTPYDRFIREQLAGDLLAEDAATGFLVTASVLLPGQIGADEPSKRLARQDALDEIVVNITQTFLGLSVACARCHDHKFDPISQRDYYAMQAFVAGVEYGDRELRTPELEQLRAKAERLKGELAEVNRELPRFEPLARSGFRRPPVNARENIDRFAPVTTHKLRFTVLRTNNLEPCIDELEVFGAAGENIALASLGTRVSSSGDNVSPNRHELRLVNNGEYGNSSSWMSNEMGGGWVQLEWDQPQTFDRVVWGRDRLGQFQDRLAVGYRIEIADAAGGWQVVADSDDRLVEGETPPVTSAADASDGLNEDQRVAKAELLRRKAQLETEIAAAVAGPMVFAAVSRPPDNIRLLTRGDPEQPKEPVGPAIPAVFGALPAPSSADESQARMRLADWIVDESNPLTDRVIVNRVWQGHFGSGLVATASDFGRSGLQPSHPELLDWLAIDFVRGGRSIKRLHRAIVLSATYRQASAPNAAAAAIDADNRLLWRFTPRRLEAEAIRDSLLAISGEWNRQMFGRGYDLFNQRGGLSGFTPIESFGPEGLRRMIYAHKVRREREAVFGAFDCPDGGQSASRREESTTPIQALNLFNSRFTLDRAQAWAERLRAEAGTDVSAQVTLAYRTALSRPPDDQETAQAAELARQHGLETLCRVLLNCNEFLFLP